MPQIFVTGVERSGATLVAAVLHKAFGVPFWNSDDVQRPKRPGWTHDTYEGAKLHGILVGKFQNETDLLDSLSDYVRSRTQESGGTWAAKSTRFSPRLLYMIPLCDDPIVIDVWRSPASVIASCLGATNQPYQGVQAAYLKARSEHDKMLARLGCPIVSIDFDALVRDPILLNPMFEQFGLTVQRPDMMLEAVQEGLIHYDAVGKWIPRATRRKLGPWGKIAVGIRTANGPEPEFFGSFIKMLPALRPGDGVLDLASNLPAHWAADKLVRDFLNSDADSILMLDDDMVFTRDDLDRLRDHVEGQQYDMLSALATRRQWPPRPITMRSLEYQPSNPMAQAGMHYAHVIDYKEGYGVFEADMTGLAFTLIRREVFEAMIGEWGPAWTQFFPFLLQQSDDAQFCANVKALGMRIGVCLDVPIGHIGKEIFGQPQLEKWLTEVSDALAEATGGTHAPAAA